MRNKLKRWYYLSFLCRIHQFFCCHDWNYVLGWKKQAIYKCNKCKKFTGEINKNKR